MFVRMETGPERLESWRFDIEKQAGTLGYAGLECRLSAD